MLQVLAFDPGVTTGVAVLDERKGLVLSRSVDASELRELVARSDMQYENVVVESFPRWTTNNQAAVEEVKTILKEAYPEHVEMAPSEWKGTPAASKARLMKSLSVHEGDAIGIASVYLQRLLKERKASGNTT